MSPAMVHSFDIFRIFRDDQPLWVEEALTLHDAMARVRQLGELQAGEYLIHSQKTDVEVCMTVRGSGNVGSKFSPRDEPLTVRYRPGENRKAET
jgi:hypothetical protein